MDRQQSIASRVRDDLQPLHLEVVDESDQHNVPPGAQSHFKLVVVSAQFQGESLVARHRRVNRLLQEQFNNGLHALALHTMTPEEWFNKGGTAPESPECLGGAETDRPAAPES